RFWEPSKTAARWYHRLVSKLMLLSKSVAPDEVPVRNAIRLLSPDRVIPHASPFVMMACQDRSNALMFTHASIVSASVKSKGASSTISTRGEVTPEPPVKRNAPVATVATGGGAA